MNASGPLKHNASQTSYSSSKINTTNLAGVKDMGRRGSRLLLSTQSLARDSWLITRGETRKSNVEFVPSSKSVMWKLSQAVYTSNFSLQYQRDLQGQCNTEMKSMVAFLWDDPKLDPWSEITRITVHQRSRRILAQSGFTGPFDAQWSLWSWPVSDPISDHPKGAHPMIGFGRITLCAVIHQETGSSFPLCFKWAAIL